MKISKKSLLTIGGIFALSGLGLMFLSVSAIGTNYQVELGTNPDNAIQHFLNAKIIATGNNDNSYAIIKKNGGLIGIETNYNLLLNGEGTNNNIDILVRRSSILGGKNNKIQSGTNETILGGENNKIRTGKSNSILGGVGNELEGGENSTIFGGSGNEINGDNSSIIGNEGNSITSNNSTVIGNNSQANGNNSTVIGNNSQIDGNNSFLWTDSSHELTNDNVFVINGEHGMVVNSKKAHSFSQLTISGSLILYEDSNAPTCNSTTRGVLKVVNYNNNDTNKICFCSCDGSGRNALHDGIRCPYICSNTPPEQPECGQVERVCNNGPYHYAGRGTSGACVKGTLVGGTGAFFVSSKKDGNTVTNYINRSCQSDIGTIKICSSPLDNNGCPNRDPESNGECTGPEPENAVLVAGSNIFEGDSEERKLYPDGQVVGKKCAYICNGEEKYYYNGGECVQCPDEAPYDPETKKCRGMNDCPNNDPIRDSINTQWACPQIVYGKCLYKKNNGGDEIYGGKLDLLGKQNKIKTYTGLVPLTDESKHLKCIDGDQFTGYFEPNTCNYECKSGSFCYKQKNAPDKCIEPPSACSFNEPYHVKGTYKTGGVPGHYAYNGIFTPEEIAKYYEAGIIYNNGYYISSNGDYKYNVSLTESDIEYIKNKLKTKIDINNTGTVVNYLKNLNDTSFNDLFAGKDFGKCVYWCDKNHRFTGTIFIDNTKYTFSDTSYRCVDEDYREYLEDHSEKKTCQPTSFFGFEEIYYEKNKPTKENQERQYVERKNRSKSSTPCKWSCPPGYEPISGWAPYYNSSIYNNKGILYSNLFVNGSYHTCYKNCENGTYLSNTKTTRNGFTRGILECKTCSGENVLDNNLIQKGNLNGINDTYRGCTCPGELKWKDGECKCTGTNRVANSAGKCICAGDTTGANCTCPGSSTIDSNYKCKCINEGETFDSNVGDCVCDTSNGYYDYNGQCVFKSTTCENPKLTWISCHTGNKAEEGCILIESDYIYNYNICDKEIKSYNLTLKIQGGSNKIYKPQDKVEYKIELSNSGNFTLTGFSVAIKAENKQHYSWNKQNISATGHKTYTGSYTLKNSDFDNLGEGTGTFTISVKTLKGSSPYFHLGNGENLEDSFTITIKK